MDDRISVHAFSSTVRTGLVSCQQAAFSAADAAEQIKRSGVSGGYTRLWDGILAAYQQMRSTRKDRKALRYLLVFTDGEENASTSATFDSVLQKIQEADRVFKGSFNLVVIAAGVATAGTDRERLQQLCRPQHCKLIEVASADAVDIADAFEQAVQHLRMLMLRTTANDEVKVVTCEGSKKQCLELDRQAAVLMRQMDAVNIYSTNRALLASGAAELLPDGPALITSFMQASLPSISGSSISKLGKRIKVAW